MPFQILVPCCTLKVLELELMRFRHTSAISADGLNIRWCAAGLVCIGQSAVMHLGDVHLQRRISHHDGRCIRETVPSQVVARVPAMPAPGEPFQFSRQLQSRFILMPRKPERERKVMISTGRVLCSRRCLKLVMCAWKAGSATCKHRSCLHRMQYRHPGKAAHPMTIPIKASRRFNTKARGYACRSCIVFTPGAFGSVGLLLLLLLLPLPLLLPLLLLAIDSCASAIAHQ